MTWCKRTHFRRIRIVDVICIKSSTLAIELFWCDVTILITEWLRNRGICVTIYHTVCIRTLASDPPPPSAKCECKKGHKHSHRASPRQICVCGWAPKSPPWDHIKFDTRAHTQSPPSPKHMYIITYGILNTEHSVRAVFWGGRRRRLWLCDKCLVMLCRVVSVVRLCCSTICERVCVCVSVGVRVPTTWTTCFALFSAPPRITPVSNSDPLCRSKRRARICMHVPCVRVCEHHAHGARLPLCGWLAWG